MLFFFISALSIFVFVYLVQTSNPATGKQQGFTLIEVLVCVIIITILVMIAVPFYKNWQQKIEAKKVQTYLTANLRHAKSNSYITHQSVIFCLLNNQTNKCHKNKNNTLILFFDKNHNNRFDIDSDQVIYRQDLNLKYGYLQLRAGRRHYVKFFGDTGLPRGHFGHIKYCLLDSNTQYQYQISFNHVGGIKFKPDALQPTGCA